MQKSGSQSWKGAANSEKKAGSSNGDLKEDGIALEEVDAPGETDSFTAGQEDHHVPVSVPFAQYY